VAGAIDQQQHSFLRPPHTARTVFRGPPFLRRAQSRCPQNPPYRRAADRDAFLAPQLLAQVCVVEPGILVARQLDDPPPQWLRRPVHRRPALIAMQHPARLGAVEDLLQPLHLPRAAPQRLSRFYHTHPPGHRILDHYDSL